MSVDTFVSIVAACVLALYAAVGLSENPVDLPPCGPACLLEACRVLGLSTNRDTLRNTACIDRHSCSMLDLYRAARELGLDARGKRLDFEALLKNDGPAILFVRRGHFVLARGSEGTRIEIADPPRAPRWYSKSELAQIWRGECLLLGKARTGQPATPPRGPNVFFFRLQHDFGDIFVNDSVTVSFWFLNNGSEPVRLTDVKTNCDCTVAHWSGEPVGPGEEGKIVVTYHAGRNLGPDSQEIVVSSNDPCQPQVPLTVSVRILPGEITARPSLVDFGTVPYGEGAQKILILRGPDVHPEAVEVAVPHITAEFGEPRRHGDIVELPIKFYLSDAAPCGRFSGTVRLVDSGSLSGEPLAPIVGEVVGSLRPRPDRAYFGVKRPGEVAHQDIRLDTHPESGGYHILETCSSSPMFGVRAEGMGLTVSLTSQTKTGIHRGTITLHTNAPGQEIMRIPAYVEIRER